ncbi:MAG: DAK2 domain-containing protein [Planctomycetaceae bacterium]|jgi:dihydroxyacetone kinase-like protein|nr:DAK2 domain-containing protein [Planctomycetaceae bacterium]
MFFTKSLFEKMLAAAAAAIEANAAMLNQLDAAIGDGDHGTAITAAIRTAAESIKKSGTFSEVLQTVGFDVMGSTSGSTSALNGLFFTGLGEAIESEELDADQTTEAFAAGLVNVRTMTQAKTGDKTLLDALIPAVEAMGKLKGTAGTTLPQMFAEAAAAAKDGAESTRDLAAKQGRARNLGERSKGHLDAGAVSTSLIYTAYAEAVKRLYR